MPVNQLFNQSKKNWKLYIYTILISPIYIYMYAVNIRLYPFYIPMNSLYYSGQCYHQVVPLLYSIPKTI